ncbi:hypothetical protein MUK42_36308, partial [Musa troglodytarum]
HDGELGSSLRRTSKGLQDTRIAVLQVASRSATFIKTVEKKASFSPSRSDALRKSNPTPDLGYAIGVRLSCYSRFFLRILMCGWIDMLLDRRTGLGLLIVAKRSQELSCILQFNLVRQCCIMPTVDDVIHEVIEGHNGMLVYMGNDMDSSRGIFTGAIQEDGK